MKAAKRIFLMAFVHFYSLNCEGSWIIWSFVSLCVFVFIDVPIKIQAYLEKKTELDTPSNVLHFALPIIFLFLSFSRSAQVLFIPFHRVILLFNKHIHIHHQQSAENREKYFFLFICVLYARALVVWPNFRLFSIYYANIQQQGERRLDKTFNDNTRHTHTFAMQSPNNRRTRIEWSTKWSFYCLTGFNVNCE